MAFRRPMAHLTDNIAANAGRAPVDGWSSALWAPWAPPWRFPHGKGDSAHCARLLETCAANPAHAPHAAQRDIAMR